MAFGAGKLGVFSIDDGGGTLRDISVYVNSCSLQTSQGIYDVTAFQAVYRAFINGFGDWKLSLAGFFDATVDGYLTGVDTVASRSVEFFPHGSPVGATKPKYSGEVIKISYAVNEVVDGVVPFALELQGTGALTRAVA